MMADVQMDIPKYTIEYGRIIERTYDIAKEVQSSKVTPFHLLLALLCGKELNLHNLENFVPDNPSLFWSALEDLEPEHGSAELVTTLWHVIQNEASKMDQPTSNAATSDGPAKLTRSRFRKILSREVNQSHSNSRIGGTGTIEPSEELIAVFGRANPLVSISGDDFAGPYHLLLSVVGDDGVSNFLKDSQIDRQEFVRAVRRRRPPKITSKDDESFPHLTKYATNMCDMAREGKLNEIIGRDEEIRRVIQILSRRSKNSAVLLGEPGVGKTAVAEGLAHRIVKGEVPQSLRGTLWSLDLGALFAGAGKGEYELRVKNVVEDVTRSQQSQSPAIIFIDELHLITVGKSPGGQNSGMDAANLLKPALARGQFRCIGATTLSEYRQHIEKDGALERRFAPVIVDEPTIDEATTILRGIRERYEKHHNVWIMDQAIVTAVKLAHRYLTARRLPDSAVDLMDEACAAARVAQDMKPEAVDTLEQEISHVDAHIRALERDTHPDDEEALTEAKKRRVELEGKMKQLLRQQQNLKQWWEQMSHQRTLLQKKRDEIKRLGDGASRTTANRLKDELRDLRGGLMALERQGPEIIDSISEFFGKNRHVISRSSPDIITPESIAEIVERATKIPVQRLLANEKSHLLQLESVLSQQVVGQPEAVKAVAHAIQVSRTGLGNTNRPIASFLFTGPSGTGKTLMSKALAKELFGQEMAMVRIDGSEYSEGHSVSRLIGSPPGYVGYDQGGQLTEYVRRTPFCIVLLDEVEKACSEFLTLFLQVLDEGRLTDGQGRLVDFRNCVIIMTSNVGAEILSTTSGEITRSTREQVLQRFKDVRFPPEFMNRIEEVVMFRTMSNEVMREILEKHLRELMQREGLKRLQGLDLDENAKNWLIQVGISPHYGARPLARMIQRELLNPLSRCLLEETVHEGDLVLVRCKPERDGLFIKSNREPAPPQHNGRNVGLRLRGS